MYSKSKNKTNEMIIALNKKSLSVHIYTQIIKAILFCIRGFNESLCFNKNGEVQKVINMGTYSPVRNFI